MAELASSGRRFLFVLNMDDPPKPSSSETPTIIASTAAASQYTLEIPGRVPPQSKPIIWDPGYNPEDDEGKGEFNSVAPVRLIINDKWVRWSVGTNVFIEIDRPPFERITKLYAIVSAPKSPASRLIQWDLIEMTYVHVDANKNFAYSDVLESPCLPRVDHSVPRAIAAAGPATIGPLQTQYVTIYPSSSRVTELQLRGQLTLRANHGNLAGHFKKLESGDLVCKVYVFTGNF